MWRDELVADDLENIGMKLQFLSWFSIHLLLHRLYRFNTCVIIESYVLYWSVSYWESLSCIFFSIHCVNTSGLKLNFEKGISIQCFRRRPQLVNLRPLRRDVECFDCDMKRDPLEHPYVILIHIHVMSVNNQTKRGRNFSGIR